jgi:hypothetical protein
LVETGASEIFFIHSPPVTYIQLCLLPCAHVSLWTWIFLALILTSASSISVHWNMPNVSSQCCNGLYIQSCRIQIRTPEHVHMHTWLYTCALCMFILVQIYLYKRIFLLASQGMDQEYILHKQTAIQVLMEPSPLFTRAV